MALLAALQGGALLSQTLANRRTDAGVDQRRPRLRPLLHETVEIGRRY